MSRRQEPRSLNGEIQLRKDLTDGPVEAIADAFVSTHFTTEDAAAIKATQRPSSQPSEKEAEE